MKKKIVQINPIEIHIKENENDLDTKLIFHEDNTISCIYYIDGDSYLKNHFIGMDEGLDSIYWEDIFSNESIDVKTTRNIEVNKDNYKYEWERIHVIDKKELKESYSTEELKRFEVYKITVHNAFIILSDDEIKCL